MERRRGRWTVGTVGAVAAALLLPGFAVAAGPVRFANGEPDHDSQLSELTPARGRVRPEEAGDGGNDRHNRHHDNQIGNRGGAHVRVRVRPVRGPTPPNWPPPGGPSSAKTLATRARKQNNYYFCGPASGQVVINWTRGMTSTSTNGEDLSTNWRRQSKIATWMNTTTAGTGGANLAAGLNNSNGVLKPTADWVYTYAENGTMQAFFNKILTDIDGFGMPLVLATAPHMANAGVDYLESWPREYPGAHHWIVVRGYDGLWGDASIVIKYQDSSAGFGGATGSFDDSLSVVYQVSKANQGGHVVW